MRKIARCHKGQVTITGTGFQGSECNIPLRRMAEALEGKIKKDEPTEEAGLPDRPVSHEETGEQFA